MVSECAPSIVCIDLTEMRKMNPILLRYVLLCASINEVDIRELKIMLKDLNHESISNVKIIGMTSKLELLEPGFFGIFGNCIEVPLPCPYERLQLLGHIFLGYNLAPSVVCTKDSFLMITIHRISRISWR